MNWLTILQYAVQYGPTVKAIWDEASSNDDAATKVRKLSPGFAGLLEQVGSQFFPKAAPALHIIGGIVASFDPNTTKWLQNTLNAELTPSPGLKADGIYGPMTRAAVERIQAQLGLAVDGIAGQLTQAAIQALLAKK